MDKFQIKVVNDFNEENLRSIFPPNFIHVNLIDCDENTRQPENAAFVGIFIKMNQRMVNARSDPVMRLELYEVEEGQPGFPFEVIIYDKFFHLVQELLNKTGNNVTPWIIFYDTYLTNYTGCTEPWSDITLQIDPKEKFNPGITFVLKESDLINTNLTSEEINYLLNENKAKDSKIFKNALKSNQSSDSLQIAEIQELSQKEEEHQNNPITAAVSMAEKMQCKTHQKESSSNHAEISAPSEPSTSSPLRQLPSEIQELSQKEEEHQNNPIAAAVSMAEKMQCKTHQKESSSNHAEISAPLEPSTSSPLRQLPAVSAAVNTEYEKPPEMKMNLNSVESESFYTVIVVVKEVIKQTSLLANGSRHTILLLVDPSCMDKNAQRDDLLLHIFFNDNIDSFKNFIEQSDVLRIENMKGNFYKKEKKMHGTISFSNAVVQFKFNNLDVVPITTSQNYIMTDHDKRYALYLRKWWQNVNVSKVTAEVEPPLKTFEAIEGSCLFNISCLITDVIQNENSAEVILRVKDGTKAVIHTAPFQFDETTGKYAPKMSEASFGATEFEVCVLSLLQEEAVRFKKGDFVLLTQVSCFECEKARTTTTKIFSFRVESVEAFMAKLLAQGSRAGKIKRSLTEEDQMELSPKKKKIN